MIYMDLSSYKVNNEKKPGKQDFSDEKFICINPTTHAQIKGYLEAFIETVVSKYKDNKVAEFDFASAYLEQASTKGQRKPFHAAIIPPEIIRINMFERGFSTSLGSTFEECAKLIALQYHQNAVRGYNVTGKVSKSANDEIEHQVRAFEHAVEKDEQRPTLKEMIDAVLEKSATTDEKIPLLAKADLFIQDKDGKQYFFEMKSPMPNKGQCLEVLQRILRFHLLTNQRRPQVQGYFSMAYNPYGSKRSQYKWSFARMYTPYDEMIIIGDEFWDKIIGPSGTMKELVQIYHEVGREKTKYIIDSLAFGF